MSQAVAPAQEPSSDAGATEKETMSPVGNGDMSDAQAKEKTLKAAAEPPTAGGRKSDASAPVLIIDRREQAPLPFSRLQTRLGTLAAGDYSIAGIENLGLFSIERKSIEDLVCCVGANRERFEAQLLRLRAYSFARLLVVGTEENVLHHQYHSVINPRAVLASLYAFEARYVPIVWSPTPQTAARLIERYATWFCREVRKNARSLLLEGSQVAQGRAEKTLREMEQPAP